ncbi:MAG: outer membrane lipoprotein carrier protein LolA [Burkholderiaceae bacterium]|nr:outer membrane lipoprotein carrier protein LolA [Burkholderiaceae bacterium]
MIKFTGMLAGKIRQTALVGGLLLGNLWSVAPASAADAIEQFQQFVQTVPAARGTFEQFTVGPDGQTSRAQAGVFAFGRPGKFRWDIQTPYPQQVASDGKTLYQYDPDLQQLTLRALDQSIGSSPAAILFGQGKLEDAFDVSALPNNDGMAWLRAVPKRPDAGLTQLDIGMRQGRPARLLLVDGFGQTTRVELLTLRAQSEFGANEFVIEPPPGTDVIRVQ